MYYWMGCKYPPTACIESCLVSTFQLVCWAKERLGSQLPTWKYSDNLTYRLASTSRICIRIDFSFVEHHVLLIDHAILFLKGIFWYCYVVKLQYVFRDAEWCWWESLLHLWVHSSGSKLHQTCTWCYCNCKRYDLPPLILFVSKNVRCNVSS